MPEIPLKRTKGKFESLGSVLKRCRCGNGSGGHGCRGGRRRSFPWKGSGGILCGI